ncbi:MAG: exo-alpha-sialidase [Verrucomicrobia bacterium]|nr:exo-alpha-sialidase [Verrucomicrobiota bacterium]
MKKCFVVFRLVVLIGGSTFAAESPLYESEWIFDPVVESHGHVHASCVVETPRRNLLAVWYENGPALGTNFYQGDQDKSDNVRIGGARRRKGRSAWEKPFVMSDTFGLSDNNPALVIDQQKRLWLFHATLLAVPIRSWESSLLWYKVSSDYEGAAHPRWERENILVPRPPDLDEAVTRLTEQLRNRASENSRLMAFSDILKGRLKDPFARRLGWMPRVHPLILRDGTLLLPLANENFSVAAMAMTRDGGETWTTSHVVPGGGVEQPSVVRLKDGRLVAYLRDAGGTHRIRRSESGDGGITWTEITNTDLPNPGAGIEAVMLRNCHLMMIYNDKEGGPRDCLAVSISTDEGKSWRWKRHLENQAGGRFDYPSLIQSRDGSLHATYSFNLKTIKHAHFNEAWVEQGD